MGLMLHTLHSHSDFTCHRAALLGAVRAEGHRANFRRSQVNG